MGVGVTGAGGTAVESKESTVIEYEANEAEKVAPDTAMVERARSVEPVPLGLAASSCDLP